MKGQSLVELLVGIAIGAIIIIGAAVIIAPSLQIGKETSIVQTETELTSELSDNVRAWAAGNWSSILSLATGTANTYYLNTATSPFTAEGSSTSGGSSTLYLSLAIDAASSIDRNTANSVASTTITTSSSTDLIVAFVSSNDGGSCHNGKSSVYSSGMVWTLSARANGSGPCGHSEIWYSHPLSILSNEVITASSSIASSDMSLTVIAFLNAANAPGATSTQAASASAPSTTLITTQPGSWIWGVGTDWTNNTGRTVGSNQVLQHQDIDASDGDTYWVQEQNATTNNAGTSVSINDTAPSGDNVELAAVEVLAASSTTSGPSSSSSGFEAITLQGLTYTRYFYLSDVYRDSNGNVTTTASGNNDPSTKLVTVVVAASSTFANPTSTISFYLTRNGDNNFNQTSWSGGAGQNGPLALVSSTFAASNNVTVNASGSIQLSTGGNSCVQ